MKESIKWSINHNRCRSCRETDYPHRAKGLCVLCYEKKSRRDSRIRAKFRDGRNVTGVLTKEKLNNEYWMQNKSLVDIAREHACTRQFIYKLMSSYGILRRSKSQARRLAIKQEKFDFERESDGKMIRFGDWKINKLFFKIWTPRMAYVLGFICADGCLYNYCLSISQKSPEILEKIKILMSCDKPLTKTKKGMYIFAFYDKEMYEDLLKLGLTPRKSLTLKFPNVPAECVRHFIRGCWDGDGSISLTGNLFCEGNIFSAKENFRASYVSGSKHFIKGMVRELYKVGIGKGALSEPSAKMRSCSRPSNGLVVYVRKGIHPSYSIKVGSRKKCGRLFHYLYDGVNRSSYMERKYEVFKLSSLWGRMPLELWKGK